MSDSQTPPVPPPSAVPAGWYPNPATGMQAYWDGTAWTEHTAPPVRAPRTQNGIAVASLILAICSFLFNPFLIPSLLAIVFGGVGIARGNATGVNKPLAIVGLALGALGLVTFFVTQRSFSGF